MLPEVFDNWKNGGHIPMPVGRDKLTLDEVLSMDTNGEPEDSPPFSSTLTTSITVIQGIHPDNILDNMHYKDNAVIYNR
jgi:hypothetical protein